MKFYQLISFNSNSTNNCFKYGSFNIDPVIGTIILIDNNNIDRESTEEIFLTIEARDNNGQGNRNMTELYIQILDVNGKQKKKLILI